MEFPLTFGLQKTGLPLILTSGKLKNICFLIDTGATHNVLFDFVYEHLKDDVKLTNTNNQIMGIEGHYTETPIVEATFNFEGIICTSTFSVLNASDAILNIQNETGIQIHGVLGMQFLMENKCVLDFDKQQISLGKWVR